MGNNVACVTRDPGIEGSWNMWDPGVFQDPSCGVAMSSKNHHGMLEHSRIPRWSTVKNRGILEHSRIPRIPGSLVWRDKTVFLVFVLLVNNLFISSLYTILSLHLRE